MAYSSSLVLRLRHQLSRRQGVVEKRMFGGVGFLLHDHLLVAVWQDSLVVRLAPDAFDAALREPHVEPFEPTGRPLRGWIAVAPDGVESEASLDRWIDSAVRFVSTLPPKKPKPAKSPKPARRPAKKPAGKTARPPSARRPPAKRSSAPDERPPQNS